MKNFIKNIKYLQINKVISVTINNQQDKIIYDYTISEKKNNEIEIIELKNNITVLDELIKKISNNLPLLITIRGKGVLTKKITATIDEPNEQIINKVLPNADINDFYISKTQLDKNNILVSIIRKTICDEIIKKFPQDKIVSLNIGENQLIHLLNIFTGKYKIRYKNNIWIKEQNGSISINQIEENIDNEWIIIANERIHIDNIESWAHCISYLTDTNTSSVKLKNIEKNKEEIHYTKLFKFTAWTILIFTFSILLINFLIFDSYNKKYNKLNNKLEQNSMLIKQIDTLKSEIRFKEDFIKNNNTNATRFSYYSDVIAKLLPNDITLTELNINPILKKLKNNKEALFQKNIIIIQGYTKNSNILNKWVKNLKKEEWIKDTEIIKYYRKNSKLSGKFEIEIIINN